MEIKTIRSYVHEIFHVQPDTGGDFTVARIENLLDGSINYDVHDNSRVLFSRVQPENPLFRAVIDAVEFRSKK
jgi:hypothetical protein